jgi:hypothetical protein
MLIFNEQKVVFLLPPKVGSSTAENFLTKSDKKFTKYNRHTPLKYALIEFPFIADYKINCFLRNPIDKFMSSVVMAKFKAWPSTFGIKKRDLMLTDELKKVGKSFNGVENMSFEDFVDAFSVARINYDLIFFKQLSWIKHGNVTANVLDFENYESSLRSAAKGLGLENAPFEILNRTPDQYRGVVTDKIVDFVKTEYAEDCQLWYEKFGRRVDA